MLRSLHLHGVGPAEDLTIQFNERLNVIAGDNGLGKSFLLDAVWWLLTKTWAARPIDPRHGTAHAWMRGEVGWGESAHVFETKYDPGRMTYQVSSPTGTQPLSTLVLHARVDGGFSVYDPARSALVLRDRTDEERGVFALSPREVWDGRVVGDKPRSNGLVNDWVAWQREARPGGPFERLCRALAALSPEPGEALVPGTPTRLPDDARTFPTLRMPYGDVPIDHASAGMRRIAALAYMLVWTMEEHWLATARMGQSRARDILLLIDEVDAHLHPRWQRVILPALLSVCDGLGDADRTWRAQFVVTTHSPLVLASLEPHMDAARDALWKFELDGAIVRLEKDPWERHGDASNWLTAEFGLRRATSREVEALIARLDRIEPGSLPSPAEAADIEREMRRTLGELDPLWVRWREMREAMAPTKPRRSSARSTR